MRHLQIILVLSILGNVCTGQPHTNDPGGSKQPESFVNLTDALIRQEIALFSFKGAAVNGNHLSKQPSLIEIPLRNCDGKTVDLFKGSTFIHLYFSRITEETGQRAISRLDSIFLVTHDHFWVRIPELAVAGLKDPILCDHGKTKRDPYQSPFYRAFQSADKRRIYVYMIGGADRERYEVTWVITDSKFYTRVVDPI